MYFGLVVIFEMYVLKMVLKQIRGEMNNKIIGIWSESVNDQDKIVGMQVR